MTENKEFFKDYQMASGRRILSLGFPTGSCSSQSAQLQILARMSKLCMKQVKISYFEGSEKQRPRSGWSALLLLCSKVVFFSHPGSFIPTILADSSHQIVIIQISLLCKKKADQC